MAICMCRHVLFTVVIVQIPSGHEWCSIYVHARHYSAATITVHAIMSRFEADVRRVLRLSESQTFSVNFECRPPGEKVKIIHQSDALLDEDVYYINRWMDRMVHHSIPFLATPPLQDSKLHLKGLDAYDAAVFCAGLTGNTTIHLSPLNPKP